MRDPNFDVSNPMSMRSMKRAMAEHADKKYFLRYSFLMSDSLIEMPKILMPFVLETADSKEELRKIMYRQVDKMIDNPDWRP